MKEINMNNGDVQDAADGDTGVDDALDTLANSDLTPEQRSRLFDIAVAEEQAMLDGNA